MLRLGNNFMDKRISRPTATWNEVHRGITRWYNSLHIDQKRLLQSSSTFKYPVQFYIVSGFIMPSI